MCESGIFRSKHNISIVEPIFKMLSRSVLYQIYVLHKRQLMTLIIYAFQCSRHKCVWSFINVRNSRIMNLYINHSL